MWHLGVLRFIHAHSVYFSLTHTAISFWTCFFFIFILYSVDIFIYVTVSRFTFAYKISVLLLLLLHFYLFIYLFQAFLSLVPLFSNEIEANCYLLKWTVERHVMSRNRCLNNRFNVNCNVIFLFVVVCECHTYLNPLHI